jgi:hypothetical protein
MQEAVVTASLSHAKLRVGTESVNRCTARREVQLMARRILVALHFATLVSAVRKNNRLQPNTTKAEGGVLQALLFSCADKVQNSGTVLLATSFLPVK